MAMNNKKCSSGRQKIPIVKIRKRSNLQVTFSKRRSGLFKKASELCTLCGVEIAIIVFSPADKAFSFGNPGVGSITNRYLPHKKSSHFADSSSSSSAITTVHLNSNFCNMNMELTQILNQLEMEKKRGEELDRMRKARRQQRSELWWESPIDEIDSVDQLQQLKIAMEEFMKDVLRQKSSIASSSSSSQIVFGGEDYYHYGSFGRYDDVFLDNKLLLGAAAAAENINVAANNSSSSFIPDEAFNNLLYQNHDMGIFKFTSQF